MCRTREVRFRETVSRLQNNLGGASGELGIGQHTLAAKHADGAGDLFGSDWLRMGVPKLRGYESERRDRKGVTIFSPRSISSSLVHVSSAVLRSAK